MRTISSKSILIALLYLPLIIMIFLIGIYPLMFFIKEDKVGILQMKDDALLKNVIWKTFFYLHIIFGGIALLTGWIQFNKFIRQRYRSFHRVIGKTYILSVWLSALGVAYIGFFAEGGFIAFLGFMLGNFIWAYTTTNGYLAIKKRSIIKHRKLMIFSYAVCVGAVTLRVWLPFLVHCTHDFIFSYQIVSWISWAPNLLVGWFFARRLKEDQILKP